MHYHAPLARDETRDSLRVHLPLRSQGHHAALAPIAGDGERRLFRRVEIAEVGVLPERARFEAS